MSGKKISKLLKDPVFLFSVFMWGVMFHSLIVGFALIFAPSSLFKFFGYNQISEKFFHVQGGVFHIVMSIGYMMAALSPRKYEGIIFLSITAKFIAVFFLILYSSIVDFIPVVFFSGIGDLIMGISILVLFKRIKRMEI